MIGRDAPASDEKQLTAYHEKRERFTVAEDLSHGVLCCRAEMSAYGRRHDYDLCRIESRLIYENVMFLTPGYVWEAARGTISETHSIRSDSAKGSVVAESDKDVFALKTPIETNNRYRSVTSWIVQLRRWENSILRCSDFHRRFLRSSLVSPASTGGIVIRGLMGFFRLTISFGFFRRSP